MSDKYGDRGLEVIAVDLGEKPEATARFLARHHPSFIVQFDAQGELGVQYDVHTMPTSVLIDRVGTLRVTHVGFRPGDEEHYEQEIIKLLNEAAP